MVNFHDPSNIAHDFITVLKLWHTVNGVYIWEYFTTLDYEWSVIRGRRPYRWTIWVYSLARLATLLAVIVIMIGFDETRPINCQAWVTTDVIFAYIGIAAASLLIVLRTIAIWNRKRIVIIIAMGTWLTSVAFFIEAIVRFRAAWNPLQGTCVVLNLEIGKPSIISMLANDMIMLLTMLIGLLRVRLEGGGTFGLAHLLWTQGIIWLFLATVAEVPPMVFIFLNLNDPYNVMFQTPALIVMTIAATRMYRSLIDFGSSNISIISTQINFQSGRVVSEPKRIPVPAAVLPFSANRMEVGVYTTSEQYPASQASHDGVYIIGPERQLNNKPHGLSLLGDDVESGGGVRIVVETPDSQASLPNSEGNL